MSGQQRLLSYYDHDFKHAKNYTQTVSDSGGIGSEDAQAASDHGA